jgi:hypothetical protein
VSRPSPSLVGRQLNAQCGARLFTVMGQASPFRSSGNELAREQGIIVTAAVEVVSVALMLTTVTNAQLYTVLLLHAVGARSTTAACRAKIVSPHCSVVGPGIHA